MIVINARGATDVKALKKLAKSLSAETISGDEIAVAPPKRGSSQPSVSPFGGATIAPATRDAIMGLAPADIGVTGEYESAE